MLDLFGPDAGTRSFYYDEVLKALPGSGRMIGTQRKDFILRHVWHSMGMSGPKRIMYESYNPGPKKGEALAIEFLQMDGIKGLLFASEKIGALLMTTTEKFELVGAGCLSVASETLGEAGESKRICQKAGAERPLIETYRLAEEASRNPVQRKSAEIF